MKRFWSVVICCTLLFGLCACGQESQLETGPFRVTPISGFAFEEEGDTIYIPEIDVVGDAFSLGMDTGATVMIQGMEMHDGKLALFLSGNEAAAEYVAEHFDQIVFVYPEVPDYMIRNLTGERLAGNSTDPEKKEWKGYIQETLKFSENPESFKVMIRFGDGDELLVNMVQAPVYNGFQNLENCAQTEYGALAVFAKTYGDTVYFEPVIYGDEEAEYQLIEAKPYHMVSYDYGLVLSEDPYVSLLDESGNVILEEVPLTQMYRTNPYEMGNKIAYCVPKEVLEDHENVTLRFAITTLTSKEILSAGFDWGTLEFTTPLRQGSVSFGELVEPEGDSESVGVKLAFGECEDESLELVSISAKMLDEKTKQELGFSFYDSSSGILWFSHRPEEKERVIIEWYSPEYRWGHTLEVPVSLR